MKRQIAIAAGGFALTVLGVVALHSQSTRASKQSPSATTNWDEKVQQHVGKAMAYAQETLDELPQRIEVLTSLDDGASWLGVETAEVTADKVKELKLPAERGVVLTEIIPDSPAAKAGLKSGDVVTEFNGQHIEGTSQFRRLIRERPPGRSVQFTVWRDGHSQVISAQLGKSEQRHHMGSGEMPMGDTFFKAPYMPKMEMPHFEFGGDGVMFRQLILGISADNLSGQLGSYFGAPDGEGVLVREVISGSAAEKAGIKAGDVITKMDGDRVRSVGELRNKIFEKVGDKGEKKTIGVALLRDHKEITVNIEVQKPQGAPVRVRRLDHRRTV